MCDVEFCSDSVEKLQFHMSVKSGKQKKIGDDCDLYSN